MNLTVHEKRLLLHSAMILFKERLEIENELIDEFYNAAYPGTSYPFREIFLDFIEKIDDYNKNNQNQLELERNR